MCFGGGDSSPAPTPAPAPAPAPAPPGPLNDGIEVAAPAKAADMANFGTTTPSLRIDRSTSAGGATSGGSGLTM